MSNLINPWFVKGYVDEQDTASAQGCYIGEDALFEGEMAAEKAIRAEREKLIYIRHIKSSIAQLKCELEKCSERHNKKRERIANQIKRLENELKQIE
jgi:hypothetical protein